MRRIAGWALAACLSISTLANAGEPVAAPGLTAAQIVEKNAAARGGLEAWRKIQTMVWVGHVESANAAGSRLPFVLEQKRPNKTRFEITADKQKSVRIFDGANGWKLRPGSSGKPELQPYTAEELKFAQDAQVIDGPLMDYAAKGVAVTLGGVDEVEGRKAYRLNVRLPSGVTHRVWIDAQSFLDLKLDRVSRNPLGQTGTVSVYYRNYQTIEGLQIPLTIETGAATAKATDKLVIDKIALNPPLEDQMFAKPRVPGARRNAVTVDTRVPQAVPRTVRPAP
jgi:hypothetical protein